MAAIRAVSSTLEALRLRYDFASRRLNASRRFLSLACKLRYSSGEDAAQQAKGHEKTPFESDDSPGVCRGRFNEPASRAFLEARQFAAYAFDVALVAVNGVFHLADAVVIEGGVAHFNRILF